MKNRIVVGAFDAEKYWRDSNCTTLPQVSDDSMANVVNSMDELLIPLCGAEDTLITRFEMNDDLSAYLRSVGFRFRNLSAEKYLGGERCAVRDETIFGLLASDGCSGIREDVGHNPAVDAYAVLPGLECLCSIMNAHYTFPPIDVVRRVNSKVYSTRLNERMGLSSNVKVLNSSHELENVAADYSGADFVIKDAAGVSGKGNILVNSPALLKRLVRHFRSQEERGMSTCVVIEPFHDKLADFSGQFHISPEGEYRFVSLQMVHNNGFSYRGSTTADAEFTEHVGATGYFESVESIAHELFHDGYFGDVCVDSMILRNGEIVPIVEINARKSMGLINHYIDVKLSESECTGFMTSSNIGFRGGLRFGDILNRLEDEKILYRPEEGKGILPLSAGTVFINRDLDRESGDSRHYRGRFYYSVVSRTHHEKSSLSDSLEKLLKSMSFNVYG